MGLSDVQPSLSADAVSFSAPSVDLAGLLPPRAKQRLQALQLRAQDRRDVVPAFDRVRTAGEERLAAEKELERLRDHPSRGGYDINDPDDPRLIAAERKLAAATDVSDRLKKLQRERQAAARAVGNVLHAVEAFVRDGRPGGVIFQDVEPPLLKDVPNIGEAIELRRRRVRELRADMNRIASSCYPASFAKQRAREQVEALAMRGAASVSRLVEHNGDIEWPTTQLRALVQNVDAPGAVVISEAVDTLGLFAWLHRDAMIKKLDAEIDTESDEPAAMSIEDREVRTAEVLADLLSVEREEAELIWRAEDVGMTVEHRADCSPLAILGVAFVTAPAGQRGTSAEHAYTIRGQRR
ncbi:MAG: hypothetical protein C0480_01145 [Bradyrhizobium sp.]|nr:hypothetical protein [Bradyrhizobium sp.]